MNRSAGSNQGPWPTDWTRAGLETTPARSCGTMGGRGTGHFAGVYIVLHRGSGKLCKSGSTLHALTPAACRASTGPRRTGGDAQPGSQPHRPTPRQAVSRRFTRS